MRLPINPLFTENSSPLRFYTRYAFPWLPCFLFTAQDASLLATSSPLSVAFTHPQSSLTSLSIVQNGLETVPHRCPKRLVFSGSTRPTGLRRLSPFARHQSLCLIATDYRIRGPVIWEELRSRSNFWHIISDQEQLVYSIPDRISPLQDISYWCNRMSRPEEACADNMGVYWYNSKEWWCPKSGEEAIYISVWPVRSTWHAPPLKEKETSSFESILHLANALQVGHLPLNITCKGGTNRARYKK
jgi:hypothetical protein